MIAKLRSRSRFLICILAFLSAVGMPTVKAQTTLNRGDIAIIQFNAAVGANHTMSFVTWVSLAVGTHIKFTDNMFLTSGAMNAVGHACGSTAIVDWSNTEASAIPAGTVITIDNNAGTTTRGSVVGTTLAANVGAGGTAGGVWLPFGTSGRALFVYQGSDYSANSATGGAFTPPQVTFNGNMLFGACWAGSAALHGVTNWLTTGAVVNNFESYLPTELGASSNYNVNGFAANTNWGQYTGTRVGGTALTYQALLTNPANWTTGQTGPAAVDATGFSVAAPPNTAPIFVVAGNSITVCQNAPATDIKALVHVIDADASQTETWSVQSAPTHGTLVITSATASSGSVNITPGGTMTYQPYSGYIGSDTFTVKVSDGTDTAVKTIYITDPGPAPISIGGLQTMCATTFIAHTIVGTPTSGYTWTSSNISVGTINSATGTMGGVQGSAPATTTITASLSSGGCTSSVFVVNTVYPLSDPGTITPINPHICVGSSITMTSSSTSTDPFYSHTWTSSNTAVATANSSAGTGMYTGLSAGFAKISYTAKGCGNFRTFDTIFVLASPSITLSASPSVAAGSTSANLDYTGTTGSATTYSITYDVAAHTAGFIDIGSTTLTTTPIVLPVPTGAGSGVYNGMITMGNVTTCSGTGVAYTVTITGPANITPSYTLSSPQAITLCKNAGAMDITSLLHISDVDTGQTETWTQQSAPTHGTLLLTSATATSGAADITPGGTITYQPTVGYSGTDAFTVRVSDGTSASDMVVNVTVTAVATSVSSQTNVACNGGSTGAATISATAGTSPYSFSWAPSGGTAATATGLAAGTYTVTVNDANLCAATQTVTISQPSILTSSVSSQTDISCNGLSNGAATVSASGGTPSYSYSWAPSGGTAATATGLAAGTYTCTITDANSCTKTQTVTVSQPSTLGSSVSAVTNVSCNGLSNGAATISATGGTPSYSYSWAPSGGTAATATGLAAGTYTCTITDANSCTRTQTVTVSQPSTLGSSVSAVTNVSCNGLTNGAVTVSATGGTPSYSYSWAPSGGTAATATGLAAGTYTCTITDANSCSRTQTATLSQPSAMTSSVSAVTNASCNGLSNGAATVSASGGTPGYTYSWAPSGGTAATATSRAAGTYTCTITDANSCTKNQTVTISQPSAINSTITAQSNVTTMGGNDGSATISASGGTPGYTYSWAPSGGTGVSISGKVAGTYTCTITDANSCTHQQIVTITQPTNIIPSFVLSSPQTLTVCKNAAATDIKTLLHVSDAEPSQTETWTQQAAPSHGTLVLTSATASSGTTNITPGGIITYQPTVGYSGTDAFTVRVSDGTATADMVVNVTVTFVTTSVSATTNVSCNGLSNGAATISASGGTPSYSYSWAPSGGTAATATGLSAGTYTVTVNDANLCTAIQTVTVTQPSVLGSSVSAVTNVSCNGLSNGAATVSASGGTPSYSYSWAPSGGTAATATGLSAGTYTCTITDANSCTKPQTVTVSQPSAITSSVSAVTNVSCNGLSNGAATVSASGGTPSYSYSWAPSGGTAATATGLAAGTYTVTITDANSCTKNQTVTVSQPSAITSSVSAVTNISCNGLSNGAATVSASGGTPSYSYSWAPSGGTAATATGLAAGTYTVTITDANSCTKNQTVTVSQPSVLGSSVSATTNVSCNGLSNGAATVSASGGTPSYSYSWAPSGGTAATATGLAAGTYTCTITDANSCTRNQTVTISQPSVLGSSVSAVTNVSCNGLSNGAATVSASGGTPSYSYSWAPSGGTAATATGLAAGTYTCTITDANSCTKPQTVTVSQPSAITSSVSAITNVSCNGLSNGAATVSASGGTPSYSYSWAPSGGTAATATGLAAGTYTCTITDANSCTKTQTVTLSQPSILAATTSQTNIACNGGTTGVASVSASGGTPSYSYSWAPSGGTGASASGLAAGSYTCTITDANSCSITKTVTITQPAVLTATQSQTNIACNGGSTGSATVGSSGGTTPYGYAWAPSGGTAATASGLVAGTYTCTITDANSCSITKAFLLTQPAAIASSVLSVTNVSCNGSNNGAATITASGGTGTLTYAWAPGASTANSASSLLAGTYSVTITDANLCTKVQTVTVTQPSVLTSSVSSTTNVSCNGLSNGAATVSASGGTPSYSYSWAPSGGTAATATGLVAGTYTCTITDANSCVKTQTVTVTQPAVLNSSVSSVTNVSCNSGSNGAATVATTGGTTSYSYSWLPSGGTAATASGLAAGTYSVTITDANLCTHLQTVTVTEPTLLTATQSQTNIACNGASSGSATVVAGGGTVPYSYSWSPSGGTAATASGLSAGTYTCTVTDANTCSITKTFTLTQPSAITSSVVSVTNVSCNGNNNGDATITASGGVAPYAYVWAPGTSTATSAGGLVAGTYSVTITDANLCTKLQTVTVTQPAVLGSSVSATTNVSCFGGSNGAATIAPTGGTTPYGYSWLPSGGTSATASGLSAGTYSVTITDANLCTHVQTVTITQPAVLATSISSQTNVTCNGGSNGAATIAPTGGTTPYSYSWSPSGGTAATASGLAAGVYICTVTDNHSCSQTQVVTITEPVLVIASISGSTSICKNDNANITVSSTAGATVSYKINGGSTLNVLIGAGGSTTINSGALAVDATYSLVSVTSGPCTYPSTGSATITIRPVPLVDAIANQSVCNGSMSTAVIFTGAVPGSTFTWTNNNTTTGIPASGSDSITSLTLFNSTTARIFSTIIVTPFANGCTGINDTFVIASNPTPTLTSAFAAPAVCNNTLFSYTPTSATATTAFAWSRATVTGISNGANTGSNNLNETLVNTTADPIVVTYVYTLTANGCINTQDVVVTVQPTPILTNTLTPAAICNNTTFSYTPTSATATTAFAWSRAAVSGISNAANSGNDNPAETLANTTANPIVVTYVYSLTANSCNNIQNVTVTVNPTPVLTSTLTPAAVCNNTTFNYVPASATATTAFAWSRAAVTGINNTANTGNDNPAETLDNTTADPITVTYVYTLTANSCQNVQNVTVTVNPTPVFTSTLTPAAICNNTVFNYTPVSATTGIAYAWHRAAVSGISNIAATGTNDPNETLHNTTTDPIAVTYVYTLTANSCQNMQSVTVTVNPTPVLTSTLTASPVCNNTTFSYLPTSATATTAFTWSRAIVTGISNATASGSDDPNETLVNTTVAPIVVTYVYTLTANSCQNIQNVTVIVQPTPMLTTPLTASPVCNNTLFSYPAASATTGTAFAWSREAVTGISNAANTGSNNPDETLVNTTADPIIVTYVYTLTANSCQNVQDVTVTVQPTPVLTSTLAPAAICNNTTFDYTPTSATATTAFTWSRAAVTGISNAMATGSDDPNETLVNTTVAPIVVTYVYTLTANSCQNTQGVTVTVNPTPVLTSTLAAAPVCNNTLFSYPAASATTGTAFAWSRATVTGISNAANSGSNSPDETLDNTTADPITVTYVYTLTANGCDNIQDVTVTVNPTPILTSTLTPAAICNNTTFNYTPTSATATTAFAWSRAAVTGIGNTAATGSNDPNETLLNTTTDPVAVAYVYTLTANGCNNTQSVTVTVNPTPVFTSTLTAAPVCNNTTFNYIPTSATATTAFAWSRAAVPGIANTAATGNDNPAEVLDNTTADPIVVTYVYTLTANSCDNIQNVTVTVQPTPVLTSTLTAAPVCNTTTFNYTPTSATTGTAFAWSRAAVAGISDAASTGSNNPAEALTNTTANPLVVTYIYTLTANSCDNIQGVTVTINPTPVLNTTLTPAAVCNNTTFSYPAASATSGTAFNWSRALVAGISNAANSGIDNPNEVLTNTTADPIVVTYVYTLTANSCNHIQDVTVTVNPTPMLTSTLTAAPVCDSTLFSYVPTSATAGTAFTWSRATVAGIGNGAANGSNNPMEYLVNTTPDPITVTYIDTLAANGCTNTQPVTVVVYPKPLLSTTLTPAAICDSSTFGYTPNSLTTGTTYAWSRATVAGISNPANADNTDPAEALYNTTTAPVAVTYVYTLTANGCTNTQDVTVIVNPTPVLTSTLTPSAVCDSTLFSYVPTSATATTTFNWSRATVAGISNTTATGTNNPMEYLVNTTPAPVTVTYVYTLAANGCTHIQPVTVVVNPKPLLTTTLTPAAICDSTLFSYAPTSATVGTVFTWSRAAVTGIANATADGSNNPLEYLDNTTANPLTVTYIDTLLANGCYNTQAVTVVVNSTPMLGSAADAGAVCNNTTFNYTPTSLTLGTTYAWSRAAVANITNLASTGTDNPAEVLVNNSNHQVTVTYIYTLTANGCSNTQTVTVKVNPTPAFSSATTGTVCSSTPLVYTPVSATTGTTTTFAWSRPTVAGISNAAGTGTGTTGIINETLVNTTLFPVNVVYHYTLTAFGCSNPQTYTAKVNPAPQAPVIATNPPAELCSNVMYQNFGAANAPTDSVRYEWTSHGAFVYNQGTNHTNALVNFPVAGSADVILTANIHGIACYTADTFHVAVSNAVAGNPAVYYVHDHFVCTDNTVDSYQWGTDNTLTLDSTIQTGEVDQNFHDASPDFTLYNYWVMTSKGGCLAKSYYNAPTGVTQVGVAETASLEVFPNPANDNASIIVKGINGGNTTVELSDITGKLITTTGIANNKATVDVSNLASGVYMVTCFHNGTKVGTAKLVKE